MMIKKLEYDNCNKEYAECTFLIETSNSILNVHIVISLIAGHVLVCHTGSDTWGHLKQWDSVMPGEVTRPFGSPRHCYRGHQCVTLWLSHWDTQRRGTRSRQVTAVTVGIMTPVLETLWKTSVTFVTKLCWTMILSGFTTQSTILDQQIVKFVVLLGKLLY